MSQLHTHTLHPLFMVKKIIQTVRPSHSSLIVLPHQISISTCCTISVPRWKIIGKLSPLFVFCIYLHKLFIFLNQGDNFAWWHKGTQLNLPEDMHSHVHALARISRTQPGDFDMLRNSCWSQTAPYSSQRDLLCHSHINTITRTISSSANKTRMRLASHVHTGTLPLCVALTYWISLRWCAWLIIVSCC